MLTAGYGGTPMHATHAHTRGYGYVAGLGMLLAGLGSTGPTSAETLTNLSDIASLDAGQAHVCAVTTGGGIQCWGNNQDGQLGDGTTQARLFSVDVRGLADGVTRVSAGSRHTCALTVAGAVQCWGDNAQGQLGDGTTTPRLAPVDVVGLGSGVVGISAGFEHSCAVTAGGEVLCWGENAGWQLGNGDTTDRLVPTRVTGLGSGMSAVAAGRYHSCAVTAVGGAKCWGTVGNGLIGDGMAQDRPTPVDVIDLPAVVQQLAADENHNCVRLAGGAVKCWSDNLYFQLADGSQSNRLAPVDAIGIGGNVIDLAAGSEHTCVRLVGDAVRCWGRNDRGQIGINGTSFAEAPSTPSGLAANAVEVTAGRHFSCARMVDASVTCWGANQLGQLGDGTTADRHVPVPVQTSDAPRRVAPVTPAADDASVAAVPDASGRYVVFESKAGNLTGAADTNPGSDIFRTDTETGTTIKVSLDDAENALTGDAIEPWVSADGNSVVFVAPDGAVARLHGESRQKRAARQQAGTFAVILRNLVTGRSQRMGTAQAGGQGTRPVISADGRSVVYAGPVVNPADGAMGQRNVFQVPLVPDGGGDVLPGATRCVSCKSVSVMGVDTGENADGESRNAQVSADGRYVAYETVSRNLVVDRPAPCPSGNAQIMLRNLITGAVQRMSPPAGFNPLACGTTGSTNPSLSGPGGKIAFQSDQPLTPGSLGVQQDIYVADATAEGEFVRVSEPSGGASGDGDSTDPVISGDGTTVAFVSTAANLDRSFIDGNGVADTHVKVLGRRGDPDRLSRGVLGNQSNQPSRRPRLNYNANRMVFDSTASNFAGVDANGASDVFDRVVPENRDRVFAVGFE
jgi:alpha-tubulin suppressor-like RCC1 family protein/Tol biopolymer transport system component